MKKIIILASLFFLSFYCHAQSYYDSLPYPSIMTVDTNGETYYLRDTLKIKMLIYSTWHNKTVNYWKNGYVVMELHRTDDYYNSYWGKDEVKPADLLPMYYWTRRCYLNEKKKPLLKTQIVWLEKDFN